MKFHLNIFASLLALGVSFVGTAAREKKIKREQLPIRKVSEDEL
jgi:hypothetical protein